MAQQKVVVTGASGLLGRAICKEFREHGFEVHGFAKSRVSEGVRSLDLLNSDAVRAELQTIRPDMVVHAAAARMPDQVEADPAGARRLNVDASAHIATVAAELGAQLLYISTEYVFDGESPPYKADAPTNPLNTYGQTKLEGEKVTLANHPSALVLRVPILYGPVEYLAESAVTTLLSTLLGGATTARVSDRERRYPAHVADVAHICRQLLTKQRTEPGRVRGVYQWCGEECFTKYGMVQLMAAVFGLPADHVVAVREAPPAAGDAGTRRPLDCRLDTEPLRQLGIHAHTPFTDGIKQCLAAFVPQN